MHNSFWPQKVAVEHVRKHSSPSYAVGIVLLQALPSLSAAHANRGVYLHKPDTALQCSCVTGEELEKCHFPTYRSLYFIRINFNFLFLYSLVRRHKRPQLFMTWWTSWSGFLGVGRGCVSFLGPGPGGCPSPCRGVVAVRGTCPDLPSPYAGGAACEAGVSFAVTAHSGESQIYMRASI